MRLAMHQYRQTENNSIPIELLRGYSGVTPKIGHQEPVSVLGNIVRITLLQNPALMVNVF
jgi:hypothetical protein